MVSEITFLVVFLTQLVFVGRGGDAGIKHPQKYVLIIRCALLKWNALWRTEKSLRFSAERVQGLRTDFLLLFRRFQHTYTEYFYCRRSYQ